MARSVPPYARSENRDESSPPHPYEMLQVQGNFLGRSNDNSTSSSKNQTPTTTLRIIPRNIESNTNLSFQSNEVKNERSINRADEDSSSLVESSSRSDEDSSSLVESSSRSDKEEMSKKNLTASEPKLSARPNSTQKKNINSTSEMYPISFFEDMPRAVIRKILFKNFIDINDIQTTVKNLMTFAAVSKFNQEFVHELLAEEGMQEFLFGITKSAIPNLFAKLANDNKEKSTKSRISDWLATFVNGKKESINQAHIDSLVHERSYLTVDFSYQKNTIFKNRGLDAVKKILSQPGLKAIRIINNLPEECKNPSENFRICNDNGLELLNALLSRKSLEPLTVDFIFNNWVPPFDSNFKLKDGSFDLICKIQDRADACTSVKFGQIDLSRSANSFCYAESNGLDLRTKQQNSYRFNFAKMMCHIGLSHSVHTISLAGFVFSGEQLALLINEIQQCENASLQHLDLSGNIINGAAIEKLSNWLQSSTVCIKTLNLENTYMLKDQINILDAALKNNQTLKLLKISNYRLLLDGHPIRNDPRVIIS